MAHLDRVAIWARADGGVSVTYFDDRDRLKGESDDDLIARISAKHGTSPMLTGAVRTVHNKTDIPADTTHQDCWTVTGSKVEVDSVKLQAKQAAKAAKQAKQGAVLSKLKISAAELKDLLENA